MIFRNLGLLSDDPAGFLLSVALTVGALVVGITIHEFSHALVATGLGDQTAKRLGRVSLNPLVHLDPLGGLMLMVAGFGWGKPVPVNALAFRNAFQGMAAVALAGPFSNIVAAVLLSLPFKLELVRWTSPFRIPTLSFGVEALVGQLLATAIFFNLVLAIFNLIPLAPLDGSKVVLGLLPRNMAASFQRLEPWGPGILLTVIMLDVFMGVGILGTILGPGVNGLGNLVVGHRFF